MSKEDYVRAFSDALKGKEIKGLPEFKKVEIKPYKGIDVIGVGKKDDEYWFKCTSELVSSSDLRDFKKSLSKQEKKLSDLIKKDRVKTFIVSRVGPDSGAKRAIKREGVVHIKDYILRIDIAKWEPKAIPEEVPVTEEIVEEEFPVVEEEAPVTEEVVITEEKPIWQREGYKLRFLKEKSLGRDEIVEEVSGADFANIGDMKSYLKSKKQKGKFHAEVVDPEGKEIPTRKLKIGKI